MTFNKDNLIVGLLVLAVIVAVGGTWVNLNKVTGMAFIATDANMDITLTEDYMFSISTNTPSGQPTPGGAYGGGDCYDSSNGTSPWPAVHPSACGGNATLIAYNVTDAANGNRNISFRWANATGTTGWLTGSTSSQWIGHTINISGDGGTIDLTGGWVNNSDSAWVLAAHDVPTGTVSWSTQIGITIDPLELQGSKTNIVQTRIVPT